MTSNLVYPRNRMLVPVYIYQCSIALKLSLRRLTFWVHWRWNLWCHLISKSKPAGKQEVSACIHSLMFDGLKSCLGGYLTLRAPWNQRCHNTRYVHKKGSGCRSTLSMFECFVTLIRWLFKIVSSVGMKSIVSNVLKI